MTEVLRERSTHIQLGDLQLLAQFMLRANNVELGDDPRSEIEVARQEGYLTIEVELCEELGLPPIEQPAV